jgi:hypothetical protein
VPSRPALALAAEPAVANPPRSTEPGTGPGSADLESPGYAASDIMRDATAICQDARRRGERLSQRALARQLRDRGHQFPNDQLHQIAARTGLTPDPAT